MGKFRDYEVRFLSLVEDDKKEEFHELYKLMVNELRGELLKINNSSGDIVGKL